MACGRFYTQPHVDKHGKSGRVLPCTVNFWGKTAVFQHSFRRRSSVIRRLLGENGRFAPVDRCAGGGVREWEEKRPLIGGPNDPRHDNQALVRRIANVRSRTNPMPKL